MITLELNTETLTEATLTLDAEGVAGLADNLQWLLAHPKDDLMFTPASWGEWGGELSQQALASAPWNVVPFLRIFHDRPGMNVLEGHPAKLCVNAEGSELSLIATESTLRAMCSDLASLHQAGDYLVWNIGHAMAFDPENNNERPCPPARIRVERAERFPAQSELTAEA